MKQEEKIAIQKLNQEGYGYKKIAAILNISIGSVRNALKDEHCLNCGKKLIFIANKKKKKFCNNSCRYSYWNKVRKIGKYNG